jgi:hypothetical protein
MFFSSQEMVASEIVAADARYCGLVGAVSV